MLSTDRKKCLNPVGRQRHSQTDGEQVFTLSRRSASSGGDPRSILNG